MRNEGERGEDLSEEFRREERKIREVQLLSDLVVGLVNSGGLSLFECTLLVQAAKRFVLARFPDKEELYEMIYGSRFRRAIGRKLALSAERN